MLRGKTVQVVLSAQGFESITTCVVVCVCVCVCVCACAVLATRKGEQDTIPSLSQPTVCFSVYLTPTYLISVTAVVAAVVS